MPFVPLRYKPLCYQCKTTVSSVWRRIHSKIACNECYIKHKIKELAAAQGNGKGKDSRVSGRNAKKRKGKYNTSSMKGQATKGRNRRVIFKKNVSLNEWLVRCEITWTSLCSFWDCLWWFVNQFNVWECTILKCILLSTVAKLAAPFSGFQKLATWNRTIF